MCCDGVFWSQVSGGGPLPPVSTLTSLHSLSASPASSPSLIMASLPSVMSLGESSLLIGNVVSVSLLRSSTPRAENSISQSAMSPQVWRPRSPRPCPSSTTWAQDSPPSSPSHFSSSFTPQHSSQYRSTSRVTWARAPSWPPWRHCPVTVRLPQHHTSFSLLSKCPCGASVVQ